MDLFFPTNKKLGQGCSDVYAWTEVGEPSSIDFWPSYKTLNRFLNEQTIKRGAGHFEFQFTRGLGDDIRRYLCVSRLHPLTNIVLHYSTARFGFESTSGIYGNDEVFPSQTCLLEFSSINMIRSFKMTWFDWNVISSVIYTVFAIQSRTSKRPWSFSFTFHENLWFLQV